MVDGDPLLVQAFPRLKSKAEKEGQAALPDGVGLELLFFGDDPRAVQVAEESSGIPREPYLERRAFFLLPRDRGKGKEEERIEDQGQKEREKHGAAVAQDIQGFLLEDHPRGGPELVLG